MRSTPGCKNCDGAKALICQFVKMTSNVGGIHQALKEEASKKHMSAFFHGFKCASPVFPAENGVGGVVSISENESISDALKVCGWN